MEKTSRDEYEATQIGTGIRELGAHLRGSMRFDFYDQELSIEFESKAVASEASWLRVKYEITDYWSGEDCKIDDTICLR